MRTISTKYNGTFEVTNEQYLILSWYATLLLEANTEKNYWQKWGIRTAGISANIDFQLFYDINIEGRIKGYQNMNRLSEIQIFDYNLRD